MSWIIVSFSACTRTILSVSPLAATALNQTPYLLSSGLNHVYSPAFDSLTGLLSLFREQFLIPMRMVFLFILHKILPTQFIIIVINFLRF